MNRVDRASILLFSLLIGIALPVAWSIGATAHPVPDFIKQSRTPTVRESQIRNILNAMETAANQKDVDGIVKYMAPNIIIKMTLKLGTGSQQLSLSRAQYQQYLQQGFETTQRYSSKYTNLKIKIAPNGKTGTAAYMLVEEATVKGLPGTLVSTSQETIKFERIKGQILATAATSNSTIEMK